eukprot:6037045-Prymnesium_polylepis.1
MEGQRGRARGAFASLDFVWFICVGGDFRWPVRPSRISLHTNIKVKPVKPAQPLIYMWVPDLGLSLRARP